MAKPPGKPIVAGQISSGTIRFDGKKAIGVIQPLGIARAGLVRIKALPFGMAHFEPLRGFAIRLELPFDHLKHLHYPRMWLRRN